MNYFACDIITKKNNNAIKIHKRFLYGIACSQLPHLFPEMSEDEHISYIKKYVSRYAKNKKRIPATASLRIFVTSYKNAVKSGLNFIVFHPPGGLRINGVNPDPKGKGTPSYDRYYKSSRFKG